MLPMRFGPALALSTMLFAAVMAQTADERARELYQRREFSEAAKALEEHLRVKPGDGAARLLLGLSYQQSGDLPRAEAAFRATPRRAEARFFLARVLYERARFAEAEAAAGDAKGLGYPASRVAVLVGLIRLEQARFGESLAAFQEAQATARERDAEPWIQAGKLLLKMGRTSEAVGSLETAVARDAGSAEARAQLRRARERTGITTEPGPSSTTTAAPPVPVRFEDRSAGAGVEFVLKNHGSARRYLPETMAGGLAVFDYDNDGRADLFFVNGAALPAGEKQHPRDSNRLYRNLGGFRFEDVTAKARLEGVGFGIGAAVADYDGDGSADLFVAGLGESRLYRNRRGVFEDVTGRAGIRARRWAVGAVWLDYDGDGRADLFVVNYLDWNAASEPYCGDEAQKLRVYCHPRHFAPLANELYRNRGDGTFEDVTAKSGIGGHRGKGMSAAVADYDGDGWPDVFVANDTTPNFLFRNRGDGTFAEVGLEAGVAMTDEGKAVSGMGAEFRDFDNDGRPDVLLTALAGETFPLFRNLGKAFRDWTYQAGLGMATARLSGWGAALADFNNDGWKDLATANSHVTDNIEAVAQYEYRQPSTVFLNAGGRFAPPMLLGKAAAHRGLAAADLDDDGRIDLVVTALGARPELWRNVTERAGHWARMAGVRLGETVRAAGQTVMHSSGGGYGTSVLGAVHFGLGERAGAVLVERQNQGSNLLQQFSCPADILARFPGGLNQHEESRSALNSRSSPTDCQPVGGSRR